MTNFSEKTLSSKTVFSGKIFTIKTNQILLPNKKTATREIALKQNAACVVALTSLKKIIMVNQFRYAINKNLWEIPAGKMDQNETPLNCAKRELLEETGFKAKHWIKLCKIVLCPGFCNEIIHIFLALNAVKHGAAHPDPDEFVKTRLFNFKTIVQKTISGRLTDAKSVCAILKTHSLFLNNTFRF